MRGIALEFKKMSSAGECGEKMDLATFQMLWVKHVIIPQPTYRITREQKDLADQHVANQAFRAFDTDADGLLDVREFVRGMCKVCSTSEEARLALLFEVYDKSGDGQLTKAEMQDFLVAAAGDDLLARRMAAEVISILDVEGNGEVSKEEFDWAMTNSRPLRSLFLSAIPTPGTRIKKRLKDIKDLKENFNLSTLIEFYHRAPAPSDDAPTREASDVPTRLKSSNVCELISRSASSDVSSLIARSPASGAEMPLTLQQDELAALLF